ncbi:hypothetical protein ABID82_003381 [Methylobacterium sp. PvP062]|jgi:hypothetical protein|uniref:Anti-sigma factor NepR domain-containing protein n=2 Tax=Methylobacterium TaxID=407 RepID=A0ABV2NCG1_9HYPH|nr:MULTISPECIES: hypothetical protein [unclassified Methylobacterium]AYO83233.1 hypothetical protein EBB05_13820 [Methylobacterium brachiatum]MCX7333514.1 hypothetical protein [Hyphomicrobiales bacterium]MDQ0440575.1 hypothetical protein [Methylobacterium persicinum]MBP2492583.1 hypothetical protein [Methylobacterium sp. PvP105]MBP2501045.1 hypothetical protein [Methylobacterium sp. PvP109]
MRQCHLWHPNRSSATQDPCLHGVGNALEDAYSALVDDTLPEDWNRLIAQLAERVDHVEQPEEN